MRPLRTGTSPNTALMSVDLPAPFGPMMPTISPRPTWIDAPRRMSTPGTYPAMTSCSSSRLAALSSERSGAAVSVVLMRGPRPGPVLGLRAAVLGGSSLGATQSRPTSVARGPVLRRVLISVACELGREVGTQVERERQVDVVLRVDDAAQADGFALDGCVQPTRGRPRTRPVARCRAGRRSMRPGTPRSHARSRRPHRRCPSR